MRRSVSPLRPKASASISAWFCVGALWLGLLPAGCTTVSFLGQAAAGQWELSVQGRPLREVIEAPQTPARTRRLLLEVERVKAYGAARGLHIRDNYERFVQLDRRYVVWFVNACAPLSFEPETFWFPFFGTFPGLGWFDEARARQAAEELRAEGWDVNVRGVTAFSTAGWFDDPVVSSMFADHPAAVGFLVDTLLHEAVHATVLVRDQQYLNESLATFVSRELTLDYLELHYGLASAERRAYTEAMARRLLQLRWLAWAHGQLAALYESPSPDTDKRAAKQVILAQLAAQVPFEAPPNNATLVGVQLYNEGQSEMAALLEACGSWPRFLAAVASLRTRHLGAPQQPALGAPLLALAARRCAPFPAPPPHFMSKQRRARERLDRFQHRATEGASRP